MFSHDGCEHYVKEVKNDTTNVFKDILEGSRQKKTEEGGRICRLLCICYNSQNMKYLVLFRSHKYCVWHVMKSGL